MNNIQTIESFLETCSEKVQRNVNIVTPETLNQNYFLHISRNNNIKQFIPAISRRQGNTEDRTVARITVAPTVLGCIIGYASADYDFLNLKSNGYKEELKYKGGWKIYALEFQQALRPTGRLVYDANKSDEHWLVAYSKETAVVTPTVAGTAFIRSVTYVSRNNSLPDAVGCLYVEVLKDSGIMFSKNIYLPKGYHTVDGPLLDLSNNWYNDKNFTTKQITKEEYKAVKNESAALLSYTNSPHYLNW